MHDAQKGFCLRVKEQFPEKFRGVRVLDVGSLDVNGNNRYLFEDCVYVGIDVGEGPNVDVVSPLHAWHAVGDFDTIISTECLEHDMYWPETLRTAVKLLKRGGLLLFTCASGDRQEHGTLRTDTYSSPLTCAIPGWGDYYLNLFVSDVCGALDMSVFSSHEFDGTHEDLYFWGVKK